MIPTLPSLLGIDDDEDVASRMIQRAEILGTARANAGIVVESRDPCVHCGSKLFKRESPGICCKNGKFMLELLRPLPRNLKQLSTSPDKRYQLIRKDARKYNCRVNFAALNVEDGELKQMFGDHLLFVQGR